MGEQQIAKQVFKYSVEGMKELGRLKKVQLDVIAKCLKSSSVKSTFYLCKREYEQKAKEYHE